MDRYRSTVWLLPAGLVLGLLASAADADVVVLRSESDPDREVRYTGEVLNYTADLIQFRNTAGGERSYPAKRLLRIESRWTEPHQAADEAFARRDFAAAAEQYLQASRVERRGWAQRLILSQLVWCHRGQGRIAAACDSFLLLLQLEARTPYLDCMPLAWTPTDKVPQHSALDWLGRKDQPAAMLLGASHLMSTNQRQAALTTLEYLAASRDKRFAALAQTQLWRARIVTATEEDVSRWQKTTAAMPENLRSGPSYLLAQALARLESHQQAALAAMRVPIHEPQNVHLAAAALVLAGESLLKLEQTDVAGRLFQEVVDDYPQTRAKEDAEFRLRQMKGG